MANYYQDDPEDEYGLLNELQRRRLRIARLAGNVTPVMARRAAEIAQVNPTLPGGIVTSATMAGVEPNNPGLRQIASMDAAEEDATGFGALWNATGGKALSALRIGARAAFIGFESIWEEGMRFFRTGVAALSEENRGTSVADLYGQSGESSLRKIYEEFRAGNEINVGAGILPGQSDPTEAPQYKARIDAGWTPEDARRATIAEIGRPVVPEARAEAEQLQYRGMPISPGRVAAANPLWSTRPGTTPYNLLSGAVDFAAQIYLDPTYIALKAASRARKSINLFPGATDEGIAAFRKTLVGTKRPIPGAYEGGAYADTTDLVSLNKIRKFAQVDRRVVQESDSAKRIDDLKASMTDRGVDEPLIFDYHQPTNTAVLADGHHRLAAADGLDEFDALPVRVRSVEQPHRLGVDIAEKRRYVPPREVPDELAAELAAEKLSLSKIKKWPLRDKFRDPLEAAEARVHEIDRQLREAKGRTAALDEEIEWTDELVDAMHAGDIDDDADLLVESLKLARKSAKEDRRVARAQAALQTQDESAPGLGQLFHGSMNRLGDGRLAPIDEVPGSPANMWGPGFYTVDDPQIAATYAGMNAGGEQIIPLSVVRWMGKGTPRILDMNASLTDEVVDILRASIDEAMPEYRTLRRQLNDAIDEMMTPVDTSTMPQRFAGIIPTRAPDSYDRVYMQVLDLIETPGRAKPPGWRGPADIRELQKIINTKLADAGYDALRFDMAREGKANGYLWLHPPDVVHADSTTRTAARLAGHESKIAELQGQIDELPGVTPPDLRPGQIMNRGQRRKITEADAARFDAGVLDGGKRPSILHQRADKWLAGKNGQRWVKFLFEHRDEFDKIRAALGPGATRKLATQVADATTPAQIEDLVKLELGITIRHKPVPQGLAGTLLTGGGGSTIGRTLSKAVGSDLGSIAGAGSAASLAMRDTRFGRLFSTMSGSHLVLDDLDRTMDAFDDLLVAFRFNPGERNVLMRRLADIEDRDLKGALDVVSDSIDKWTGKLVENGMDPKTAKAFTQNFQTSYSSLDEMRKYFLDPDGMAEWFPGAKVKVRRNGEWKVMPTAQLWTEYINRAIPLPDPRAIRRAQSKFATMGQKIEGTAGLAKLTDERALVWVADKYMQKIWKPMVLLRVAWPIRVIGEEQLRLAAAGYMGAFNHPMSWWAWMTGRKGKTGIASGKGILAELDEFQAGMSGGAGGFLNSGSKAKFGTLDWVKYEKGSAEYIGGWSRSMTQLWFDPLAQRVAAATDIADVKAWMRTNEGSDLRKLLAGSEDHKQFLLADDWDQIDAYVDSVEARIRRETGGTYKVEGALDEAPTNLNRNYSFDGGTAGNAELRKSIADGKLGDIDLHKVREKGTLKEWKKVMSKLNDYMDDGPQVTKGPKELKATDKKRYDDALNSLFGIFMSTPTNKLSRSPVFRQAYWKRVGELMPFADEQAQKWIITKAAKANVGKRDLNKLVLNRPRKATIASQEAAAGSGRLLRTEIDDLAKAYALGETRDLLYDLSKRHEITDILRNFFPFGEAYIEIVTTWERIMFQHPEIFRRAQQGFEASRESGFFTTNDQGEEMFNVPGGGMLAKWMFGETLGEGGAKTSFKLQGRLAGLNLITGSYLPGFGPVVQIPASNMLPDEPHFDGLRDFLIPYGPEKINFFDVGDYLRIGFPSWIERLGQAAGSSGEYERLYNNTVIDIMKGLLLTGRYSNSSPEQFQQLLQRAKGTAKWMAWVRGAASFVTPTAINPEYNVWVPPGEDAPEGTTETLWGFQALVSEYRRMRDEDFDGDDTAAFVQFRKTFGGLDPTLFSQAKTTVVRQRSTAPQGVDWERSHSSLFRPRAFPNTAYFAAPDDPDDPFDYNAYLRQIETKTRVPLDPEQWTTARNHTLGRIAYDLALQQVVDADLEPTDEQARQFLKATKVYLMMTYPGYNEENIGTPKRADTEQLVRELYRWEDEPDLHNTPAGRALQLYLTARDTAQQAALAEGLDAESFRTAESLKWVRDYLRSYAEWVMGQEEFGDFRYMWTFILNKELRNDLDPNAPGDPFTGQVSDQLLGATA